MKFQKIISLCVCALLTSSIFGQDLKFGKVSKAELEEKFNPTDSSAPATYLYKYRKTYFEYLDDKGFSVITKVHCRIKIYNKDGFDYSTKKIPLYKNSSDKEKVSGLKAVTYNLKNGKIDESKLKKDGEFTTERSEYWNEKSFTMPNIEEGSVIEYKYEVRSPFISNIDEFVFQEDIPIKQSVAIMDAPHYFKFRVNSKGFLKIDPINTKANRKLTIRRRVAEGSDQIGDTKGIKTTMKTATLDYTSNITTYEMNNVPALKEEPYINGIQNYRSGAGYELSYTEFPNSPIKTYATNWETVVKSIYERSSFGGELKKTGYFEKDVDALISGASDPGQKILKIFNHVKSKVKWNDFYGKYTISGVKKAYKEGVGNIAEINLMLTSMLRYAGLEANPVLVSTRANGIPLFPTREGYNYVISSVKLADGFVLLDASEVFSTPNVLPFRTLNWNGRIIKKDGSSSTIALYPNKSSLKRVLMNGKLSETGNLDGKIRLSYGGHDAIVFRKSYYKTNEEDYLEELEKEITNIEIDNFEVKDAEMLSKSPTVSYDYVLENGSEVVADKLYFTPLSFLRTKKNPFTLDNREFPVDFGYPTTVNIASNITLPEGYTIENIPESMSLALPEGLGSFKFMISNNNNVLQMSVVTKINNAVISPVYYESLKQYYKAMIEKMNEKVVLTKV